ncbi:hypothetical protein [Lihuaxuella thermophila]|uniref:Uncharacterized protein n=1 Tax=Lihuaxuella thermophila TaxID=1173111 RepID=A0A1H8BJK8_9BACL|nr:hypothetical protein [Lihuaxuella thermophila]SEM82238.1 hypothetical protein SAMN05444955_102188 [Lihuaxuella thermophila]
MEKKKRIQPIRPFERYRELDLGAQLADLKLTFYQQSLLLTALIDLLIEKGTITREDLTQLVKSLDRELSYQLEEKRRTERFDPDEPFHPDDK